MTEGVESEAQLRLLKGYHCDYTQGWLFGRPAEPDEIQQLLAKC